jgi:osmotically inducible protein OsmC
MATRHAEAEWSGTLRDGSGRLSVGSGAFNGLAYSFRARTEDTKDTNPEELIGAAHAGCFTMALSAAITQASLVPERIQTRANVQLRIDSGGLAITRIDLVTRARVPGIDVAKFAELANDAKKNCPVSRALAGVEITLDAKLE